MDKVFKYKDYELLVELERDEDGLDVYTITQLINLGDVEHQEVVNLYDENVFQKSWRGTTHEEEDVNMTIASIKRGFSRFARDYEAEKKEEETEVEVEVEEEVEEEAEYEDVSGAVDKIIFDTVGRAMKSKQIKDKADSVIQQLIKENGIIPHRKIVEIKYKDNPKKDVGLQHKDFENVLRTLSAGVNIALVGPAGSGKTTIVSNAAENLELSFASQSVSAQSTVFDFFGYKSATGEYIGTMFREKYENGGVFLLDEFDAGNPNVLAALNQATANGHCPFPDKMVEKHKDFIIVMAGNTFGGGGTIDYVGRNKIDAATLDRFAFIYIDYDEHLESELSDNESWCKLVQAYRRRAVDKKIRTIISPRATFNGERLLKAGIDFDTVKDMIIFKGLTEDEKQLLNIE